MARIVPSLQLARSEDYCYTLHLHFHRSIENFSAYSILRAALFSAASPAERLRSAGSLAINTRVRGKSILANQYTQKYCSRSLSNKEPLYIFMQKDDVT